MRIAVLGGGHGSYDAAAYRRGVLARQLTLLRRLGLAPEPGAALKPRV